MTTNAGGTVTGVLRGRASRTPGRTEVLLRARAGIPGVVVCERSDSGVQAPARHDGVSGRSQSQRTSSTRCGRRYNSATGKKSFGQGLQRLT
jgi:hypothetical protein